MVYETRCGFKVMPLPENSLPNMSFHQIVELFDHVSFAWLKRFCFPLLIQYLCQSAKRIWLLQCVMIRFWERCHFKTDVCQFKQQEPRYSQRGMELFAKSFV